ncbi:MAG: restriction endonuclease subunit S [Nitrospirae bacterium]|nr:restriction endonuclease subunit S [Nitrospirota bacterium]
MIVTAPNSATGTPSAPSHSELPERWTIAKLLEVCELNPKKPARNALPKTAPVSFVPMAAVDEKEGAIRIVHERAFASVRNGYTAFREGDVLMAKITPCMENGKAAVARGLKNGIGFGSSEFHVLRPSPQVLPEFIFHFIRQESFRRRAENEMTGSVGQERVPTEFFDDVEIPFARISDQKRLVAVVETLLAQAHSARERLARVRGIMKRFRQSVLAAACSGRLTADWREEEAVASEIADEPWQFESIASVCSEVVDCPHSTPKWADRGEICLRTTNFTIDGLDLSTVRYVSRETYSQRVIRLEPRQDDIVYSREGGILGIACIIPAGLRACLGQRMMLMRCNQKTIRANFLCHVLNSPQMMHRVVELTGGSASPHLNVGVIKRFPVPSPRLEEQDEILRRVESLFRLADKIEERVSTAAARADKLTQSILAKAFRGELFLTHADSTHCEPTSGHAIKR